MRTGLPHWLDEVGAFALIILGGVVLSALLSSAGGDGALSASIAHGLRQAFGIGAYLVSLVAIGLGVVLLLPKFRISLDLDWIRILGVEIALLSLQGLFHLFTFEEEGRAIARAGEGGGYVGWAITSVLLGLFGFWLALFILMGSLSYSAILFFRIRRRHIRAFLAWMSQQANDLSVRLRPEPKLPSAPKTITPAPSQENTPNKTLSGTNSVPLATAAVVSTVIETPARLPSVETPPPAPSTPATASARGNTSDRPISNRTLPTPPPPPPSKSNPVMPPAKPSVTPSPPSLLVSRPSVVPPAVPPTPSLPAQPSAIASVQPAAPRPVTPPVSPASPLDPLTAYEDEGDIEEEFDLLEVPLDIEERFSTMMINGRMVAKPSSIIETNNLKSQRRSEGKRYFVVDGFQDKVKIGKRHEALPPLELLKYNELKLPSEEEVNTNAQIIENSLLEFDIDADVIDVRMGPTVTQYAVSPIKEVVNEAGETVTIRTRVGKIAALADDLALALSARRLRIEAPVPGFSYVGIEVPNREPSIVSLRSVLESVNYYKERKKPLALPLGRDVSGEPVVTDLATMPHLLIAGTTGSGKSICLRSFVTSLVMNNTPDTLRMILLDPKMVELPQFNGLPHLLGQVETDLDRIIGVLRWTAREMDRRYKLLELENARNIEVYNHILGKRRAQEHLPYMVLIIDEIGDLMMSRPEETEKTVTRLAQKARAAGIHLVIATQRPSVDVVTGLIKANFPGRISFAVASGVDSRVILDTVGAETLMGKGDMLFLASDAAGPQRIQGCYVSDEEINEVVMYWRNWHAEMIAEGKMDPPVTPPWERAMTRLEALSELDPLLEEALKLVVADGTASTSLLQRKLAVSFPRAARLMDSLHELGIIGAPQAGGRTREVLVKSVEAARRMVANNRARKPTDDGEE